MVSYELKVLTTKNAESWTKFLEETGQPDIYFTPEYAKIYEDNYGEKINEAFCGKSMLVFFGNNAEFIIYPFIKRRINDLPFMKKVNFPEVFDIISQYGYGGPLVMQRKNTNRDILVKSFMATFKKFCSENKIITEFIRFHPLLNNHEPFNKHIPITERNTTIFIDLTQDEQTLLKNMNKKTRNLIRKAEKHNIQIERSTNKENLEIFTKLYLQTMEKKFANKKYFFPLKFYENTLGLLKNNVSLFIAKYTGEIVAASLFMHKYDSIHYHFSGSKINFLNLAPNNLLLWKVMLWAKKQGFKKFHLGGGISGDDGLYHFKAGLSNTHCKFHTASIIHNNSVYEKLCKLKDRFEMKNPGKQIATDFFPYYRRPGGVQ